MQTNNVVNKFWEMHKELHKYLIAWENPDNFWQI